jgi:hypothetical protein
MCEVKGRVWSLRAVLLQANHLGLKYYRWATALIIRWLFRWLIIIRRENRRVESSLFAVNKREIGARALRHLFPPCLPSIVIAHRSFLSKYPTYHASRLAQIPTTEKGAGNKYCTSDSKENPDYRNPGS